MNKIPAQYIKNAKAFFPIYTSKEHIYVKNLELDIEDYCEDNHILSLEELYQKYGSPSDVAHMYFSNCDTEYILKKLQLSKILKRSIIALVTAVIVALSTYCVILHSEYESFIEQQIFFEETTIE